MRKRYIPFWSASRILILVFGMLGIGYLLIGGALCFWSDKDDGALVGTIFLLLSAVFLLPAVCIQIRLWVRERKARMLVQAGKYLWGEIVQIMPNYHVHINEQCLYNILVRYASPDGTIHIFKSPGHRIYPDPSIIGKQVRVYYADTRFKSYYVYLDGVLPQVVEH